MDHPLRDIFASPAGRTTRRGNLSRIAAVSVVGAVFASAIAAAGAVVKFDFGLYRDGRVPAGFASLVSGPGKTNQWKTMDETVAPILPALNTNAPIGVAPTSMHTILAASSADSAPNRAGILLFTNEAFGSFTVTTRFKILGGTTAPEAGIAFRVQDESNYYVIRASTQGNLLWYRVVGGVRHEEQGIGVRVPIAADTWHELRVECNGNTIRGFLNERLLIPPVREGAPTNDVAINDSTFTAGKVGFWTAGDTSACFAEAHIDYTERVPLIQTVIASVMKKNSRLLGLKVYGFKNTPGPVVIADGKGEGLGEAGGKPEMQVLQEGQVMYLKTREYVEVTQPLRDRNGDVIAALKTRLTTFRGETQDNAVMRATQIKKAVESGLATLEDIND